MLQYPDVLTWMNRNLKWLDRMGFAVANQQEEEVLSAAIQRYTWR